ncbi:hypothetical protein [Methylobacterium thuringiense]|uniref:hypothetical protein n=1 Tax=Methylobacterium thuringiense TaxID=1003091 RepID=UPI001EDF4EFA|nr:hypothetical protein [Methylobacterium thuringiense]
MKQRAASLKATAGRVIRSPKSGSPKDLIARAKQHPGMMAYPAERPTSLVAVRFGLRLEAQRLLATALDEFARLYEAQSEGAGEATCRTIEGRLKRELRIDALRVAAEDADPDATAGLMLDLHAMAGGVIHDDGRVSFCDADGRVLRKPVTDWIGFTASRLYASARKEMARQVNDPALDDAGRSVLSLKLRRDLRLDALHVLAFRSAEAFDLTQAKAGAAEGAVIPEPRMYRAGPASMDLQRAIEAHREAVQMAAFDPVADAYRGEARRTRVRALADAVREIPARSHADLRLKVLYLWPGNVEGETVGEDLSETLLSFHDDVMRLGSEPAVEAEDPALTAIAASRAAEAEMAEWQTQASARPSRLTEPIFAEEHQLCIVQSRTRDAALSTVPTTQAGRLALVEYVRFVMDLYGMGEQGEGADNLHV